MLTKKSKSNILLMEVRQILLGNMVRDEGGKYVALNQRRFPVYGIADGAQKVKTVGITRKNYIYSTETKNNQNALFEAGKIMNSIGRMVEIQSIDNNVACLVRTYIFYPVVLVMYENEEKEIQLSAFTGRSFTARLAIYCARRKFDKGAGAFLDMDETRKDVDFPESFIDRSKLISRKEKKVLKKLEKQKKLQEQRKVVGKSKKRLISDDDTFEASEKAFEYKKTLPEDFEPVYEDDEMWDGYNWVPVKKGGKDIDE
ncbi:hypothetical protein SAMN04487934_103194 [Eubacterium ruminantium]|nr:hypothetical protein SAMN04487934_103194 [Eubacterium ruminantium]